MAFVTKKLVNGVSIEITQLADKCYAKIKHQPFDKYIVVCRIKFKSIDEETISDITIYNPSGGIADIINEFNFLDSNGNDTLKNVLKENLCRSVFYNQYESSQLPYFMDIGFTFGYH